MIKEEENRTQTAARKEAEFNRQFLYIYFIAIVAKLSLLLIA
jgi:hypothetical protein